MKRLVLFIMMCFLSVSSLVCAENFCCNPETYVCEDCQMCPNPDCSTCDFEDSYNLMDSRGNVIGTVHIIKTAEITFMYQCFILGNHTKCTGYFLDKN